MVGVLEITDNSYNCTQGNLFCFIIEDMSTHWTGEGIAEMTDDDNNTQNHWKCLRVDFLINKNFLFFKLQYNFKFWFCFNNINSTIYCSLLIKYNKKKTTAYIKNENRKKKSSLSAILKISIITGGKHAPHLNFLTFNSVCLSPGCNSPFEP